MKKIINILLMGGLLVGLSSCLKDKSLTLPDADGAIKNVIEFNNVGPITSPVSSNYPVYSQAFDIKPTGQLEISVNYAGVNNAPNDIKVKVELDANILAAYNAKIIKDARDAAIVLGQDPDDAEEDVADELFEALNPALYSLGGLDLVIPKGQRKASFILNVKPDQFSFDKNTALAFKISSASEGIVSGNFGSIIVKLAGKNRIDGVYNYKSASTQSLRPGRNDNNVHLETTGATTVKGNLVNYYSNIITYNIDETTNKVTVVSVVNGIGAITTDPSSNYNPTTKVLYVKWTAGTYKFEETYTYTGSR